MRDGLLFHRDKILRGHQPEETERLICFRSHWGFQTEFCNPARGNEKGGVEGEVGYFRRNHLVPVPQAKHLEELNQYLQKCCQRDEQRRIAGKPMPVGEAMRIEPELFIIVASVRKDRHSSVRTADIRRFPSHRVRTPTTH